MDPLIGSAIIGGLASLFGGKKTNDTNLQAQREANQTNLQIAQMNNDFNKQMFDQQLQYNTEMWNKQSAFSEQMADKANQFQLDMWNRNNEYNDPANQASRLRSAGLNPYMMMNGGSAGSASFSGGNMASTPGSMGVNPPTATPVSVSPVMSDGSFYSAIGDMITRVMDAKLLTSQTQLVDEQARQVGIENKYKAMDMMSEISQKIVNTRNTRLRNIFQGIQNSYAKDMFQNEVNKGRQEYAIAQMQENIMATDYMMKQIQLSALPAQIKAGLAQSLASTALISAQKGMTIEQTRKVTQDKLESIERTTGIKISNKERRQCLDAVVKLAEANADKAKWDARHSMYNSGPDGAFGLFNIGQGFFDQLRGY